jgi:hypothetical protein
MAWENTVKMKCWEGGMFIFGDWYFMTPNKTDAIIEDYYKYLKKHTVFSGHIFSPL